MEQIQLNDVYTWFDVYNMEEYDIMNLPQTVRCQNIETLNELKSRIKKIGLSHSINFDSLTIKL